MSARPEWFASTDFLMLHLDLIDALDGSWEAAGLLQRIHYRAGTGWWEPESQEVMFAEVRLTSHKGRAALKLLREKGMVVTERIHAFESPLRYRVSLAGAGEPDPRGLEYQRPGGAASTAPPLSKNGKTHTEHSPAAAVDEPLPGLPAPPRLLVAPSDCTEEWFNEWYDLYPKKAGKADARKAYARALRTVPHERLLDGLRSQLPVLEARERQYRPDPATWLNKGRWDDECLPSQAAVPTGYWDDGATW